ncbi:AP-3 complex subunit mu-2 isoform X1 [Oryctolagus cuniculus]|uniref:AP-3 complex subunit mu-2 n=1 Tax=Oryctolagus cuniculus TaxID=9986 RepID=A0A5F9C6P4_RABIT|nr:AP-3 complex subunit mu-2 isoform X1 [Oryctolagus cuniculus]XP_008272141.1 AP-3 complex subunit mu-2 isoform X1 [Oryctolagus cuniculus]XP_008272144.1 AP-3 complex subunit mu-2 isoform X1 [Oryctolagus cuniculus]XP_051688376.1 AP-3 complex subunit mu-2 isoform X1 [Oryctolagus cuniculus]XP_051688377.1 AP-3 complex subunit mu-2 isoform X1 [Oryctolagus cuniculus]
MIHSLFLINSSGDIFLEKHWKSVVSRSVCDYFFEAQERATEAENVPPVIPTPHHYLLSVYRHKIFFVAVIQTEVPPLFVIEFLHRVVDTFQDYFGVCSEPVIKDNVVVVYEVLEEMLDNGFPLATESNILKELIKPPTILRTVVNTITGRPGGDKEFLKTDWVTPRGSGAVSPLLLERVFSCVYERSTNVGDQLPTGQLSVVPWRRTGVKYTNNEAYFDVIEEIDAIIDKSGSTITAEIQGVIDACVKLTGMPDLTLSFMNPRLLDDVSFHPCVRFKRWESERILSFIPPDGNFRLLSYHVSAQNLVAIPVYVKHSISFRDSSALGRFEITVGPKQTMGKTIEGVLVSSQMPKGVLNMSLTPSQGTHTFDPVTKMLSWDVGKINPQKLPSLKGTMSLQAGAPKPDENPTVNLQFKIQQLAISGLKVNRLDMYGEKYKPFKGIKYMTKAGKFQVRT